MKDEHLLLYIAVGVAIGAMAVFIFLTQMNKTDVVDFTRDAEGRIITIVQKKV